jgi:hypothetical protein
MRFSSQFVVNFEVGHRRPASMASEWLHERYQRYKDKMARERLREHHQASAIAKFPSMFEGLRTTIVQDVTEYNGLFGQKTEDHHCRASIDAIPTGFVVAVGSVLVRVTRQAGSTVISMGYSGMPTGRPSSDHIDVATDDQGKVGFRHGGNDEFIDAAYASQIILGPVLCG